MRFINEIRDGDLVKVQNLIEQHNGNVNAIDDDGSTVLMYASRHGHLGVVKYLIEKHADVNMKDGYSKTALIYAVLGKHLEVVKYLVEYGKADVYAVDNMNMTALKWAEHENNMEIAYYLRLVILKSKL